jgi:two-component system, NarL family, sensor kinase
MMRFFFIFLVNLFLAKPCFAQDADIEAVFTAIRKSKEDTSLVKLLLQASEYYLDADNDSALYFNNRAELLIDQLKAESYRHRCYHHFVKIYHAQFNNPKALEYCLKAIEVAKRNKNVFQEATSYRAVFNVYHNLKQDDSAVKYGVYALNLTERIGDTVNIATNYGNLCRLYSDMEQFEKAIAYGKKGVDAGEKYSDKKGLLISMNNLGNCYLQVNRDGEAIPIFEELLVLGKKYKRARSVENALINLGVIYFGMADKNNLEKIAGQFKKIETSIDANNFHSQAWAHVIYAYSYILNKQYKLAEVELLAAEDISINNKSGNTDALENIYLALAKINYAQENFLKGNMYDSKWDSLYQGAQRERLSEFALELEEKYGAEAKAGQIKMQQVELRQKTNLNYVLASMAFLIFVISILLYRNYQNKQKLQKHRIGELETEKQLTATEAVLKGEEKERTRLAKDLHDGLGGILSGVKFSLTTMKGNLVLSPETTKAFERSMDMLDSSIQEMRRVAHNMMPEALLKFGLDAALKDFCNDINSSGALKVNYQSIGLDQKPIDQTNAIAIYRIVQELLNNTMKHAAAGRAIVQVTHIDSILSITVEDDGKGFDTTTLKHEKGIGWTNIQNRIEFLKGKLDITSQPGKGTSVHIELTS